MDELINNDPQIQLPSLKDIRERLECSLKCPNLKDYMNPIREYFSKNLNDTNTKTGENSADEETKGEVEAELETNPNYNHLLDSIFDTLQKNIEDGMSISKIKTALRKGMDDIKSIFTGRWKIIEIYVKSKMNEIKALRRKKEVNLNVFNRI